MGEYRNDRGKISKKHEKNKELVKSSSEKENKTEDLKEEFIPNENNQDFFVDYENFDPNEEIEESMVEFEFFDPNEDFEVIDKLEENTNNFLKDKNYREENKEVREFEERQRIKDLIRNLNWENITEDWTINYQRNQNQEEVVIQLDPKEDNSETNPLYKHKAWLEKIYTDQSLNLNDTKIGEICNLHKSTIGRWRRIHKIPTKPSSSGQWIDNQGYIRLYMTEDYNHPELMSHRGEGKFIRFEHALVMEEFLSNHPELDWTKKYLIDGKYLKSSCSIHHINLDPEDNQLQNLWICKNESQHQEIQSSLLNFTEDLLKAKIITFKNGEYKIKVKNKEL